MLKKIVVAFVLILIVLAVVVALQPSEYQITRSIAINAPTEVIFAKVNDFQQWSKWSPWEQKDPAMKREFDGAAVGTGAIYRWDGNDDVGTGSMTIIDSKPPELVSIKLEFQKPMESEAISEFKFQPQDQNTVVTWTMRGTNNFLGKGFFLLMNLDKLVGGDFEKGLAALKQVAEESNVK